MALNNFTSVKDTNRNTYASDRQLADRFSVSRATIWRWLEAGRLPKPVKLSPGCTRWRLADIEAFERRAAGEGDSQ